MGCRTVQLDAVFTFDLRKHAKLIVDITNLRRQFSLIVVVGVILVERIVTFGSESLMNVRHDAMVVLVGIPVQQLSLGTE